mgnify:CR=1 FL=1
MPAEYRARIEAHRPQLHKTARETYGVEMNPGPFGLQSRPALIGAKVAEAHGRGAEFHARVMRAYWEEAQDIEQLSVLAALAEESGLDAATFMAALREPAYNAAVEADIEQASLYGLSGVPAIVFDNKYLVSGAQPADALRRLADRVLELRGEPVL